jgi:hypothetical protein
MKRDTVLTFPQIINNFSPGRPEKLYNPNAALLVYGTCISNNPMLGF